MTILIFVSALLISSVIYLFGKYTLLVSLFIKATWVLLIIASGLTLFYLYRKLRGRNPSMRRLTAQLRKWTATHWEDEKLKIWKPDAMKSQSALSRMAWGQVFRISNFYPWSCPLEYLEPKIWIPWKSMLSDQIFRISVSNPHPSCHP